MRQAGLWLLLALAGANQARGQTPAPVSLDGRVAPPVATQVQALADSLARTGIPGEPLLRKALEGSAKGVPADRIVAAVRTVAGQLELSAASLRSAGAVSDSQTVEAGAYAINAGLKGEQVAAIARASRPPYQPAASLQSAGTLVAMGVPASQAVALIQEWIKAGRSPRDVGSLPSQVQAAMGPGLSAAQAAQEMSKGGGRGANPTLPPPRGNPANPPNHTERPDPPHRP
jgi:hypothetical protein